MTRIWENAIRFGLLTGVFILYAAVIGMIEAFSKRAIIYNGVTLGQLLIFGPALIVGYTIIRRTTDKNKADKDQVPILSLLSGGLAGLCAALPLLALLVLVSLIDIRSMFVNVSPPLIRLLTFEQEGLVGGLILLISLVLLGLVGAGFSFVPARIQKPIVIGLSWTLGIGLLSELFVQIIRPLFGNNAIRQLFQSNALRPITAIIIFIAAAMITVVWSMQRVKEQVLPATPSGQRLFNQVGSGLAVIILLGLPWILGSFLSEVLANVGLYILMGLGLNIAIGLAGLLDLGYVTNFAVGAYVMAVLTSTGPLGLGPLNFWLVLPISLLAAMCTGFMLALPVLKMRGDYLAIATLGFGEIIRILALSDWLRPYIGGAQGILAIPKAQLFNFTFSGPQQIYYLLLAACLVTLFVMLRLNNSRTGRQWMAMREDEDAASAMGIDITKTKVLAFTLSAATGGVAGAIFASKLGTIFPHSFNLLISINALSLIIIGGIGSIPGIVIGALVLIGLPELLREFAEYRLLLYGALLVTMMLLRPEGLWPSAIRRRELHEEDAAVVAVAGD